MKQPFKVGQKVSAHLWDATDFTNRIGSPATVTDIMKSASYESGWRVTIVGTRNTSWVLDSHWLAALPESE